jgi:tetratricopeptide (TPR) repeat protein
MRARRGQILIAFYRGNGDEALRLAQEAAARSGPDDIEALLARAEAYALNGGEDLARSLLARIAALDPGNQAAAWLTAIASHRSERFQDAARDADDYVRRFGDDPFVHVLGASARERLGDIVGARERYDRAVQPLMGSSLALGSVTAYDLTALLAAGAFHDRGGQPDRAQLLWKRGLDLSAAVVAGDQASIGPRLFLASFHAFLGDRQAFAREEAAARKLVGDAGLNPWEMTYLASAYAGLGDDARAVAAMRQLTRAGRLAGRSWLSVLVPRLRDAPAFPGLLRDYDAVEARVRDRYLRETPRGLVSTGS